MANISIPEQRFREKSGEQYTSTGKIRCHGLAKSRVRQWREEFDDYETPSEDLWPECQCHKPAVEGYFVCGFHGGKTPRLVNPPRTILDVMPLDMADKYRKLLENPDYISRKEDILLIKARQWELLEELQIEAGSDEAWGLVHDAAVKFKRGDDINGLDLLQRALDTTRRKEQIWGEIYQTEKLLGDLTTTQMKTAKDLQTMATHEQVNALMETMMFILTNFAAEYIDDPTRRNEYKQRVINEIRRLTNITPQAMLIDQHND